LISRASVLKLLDLEVEGCMILEGIRNYLPSDSVIPTQMTENYSNMVVIISDFILSII